MQPSFSKSSLFSGLPVVALVIAGHALWAALPDRIVRPPARAAIHYSAETMDASGLAPFRLAGAWRLTSAEPRMGGVSALAIDRGNLLAVTDSGVVIRLSKPVSGQATASFRDLPDGPGSPERKAGRDSEALARDPTGRGWWVTFENRHRAMLFDARFGRSLRLIDLDRLGWRANLGVEAAVPLTDGLLLFPEAGNETVRLDDRGIHHRPLANPYGRLSDAAILPDGRLILVARAYGPAGFRSRLLLYDALRRRLESLAALPLGRLDNVEAIAAEALPGGGVRLWLMTDNDYRRRVPTLLLALDWAG